MSFGPSILDSYWRAAAYVDKIRYKARRPPRRATHQVRAGDQPQDR